MLQIGVDALPMVSLMAICTGFILAMQGASEVLVQVECGGRWPSAKPAQIGANRANSFVTAHHARQIFRIIEPQQRLHLSRAHQSCLCRQPLG